ncbi:SRPBCC family protein [Thermasporomyces composti]|jgi:uncharacterized membrane protein|uniref:Putative membrane protein n=1 Tax=Thermasporomyces composti TaxID=696763 RepID=A0A3D9VI25_THECX|nr:SRPBCC family protein [Thermasporomyces composti]REF37864.1 putative membrane protein [Thermasporomyces composti]
MTETTSRGVGPETVHLSDIGEGVRSSLANNPATKRLMEEVEAYVGAKAKQALGKVSGKLGDTTRKLTEVATSGGGAPGMLGRTLKEVAGGASPVAAAGKAGIKGVAEKATSMFKPGGKTSGGKSMNIVEDIDIGAPLRVVYNHWTKFEEFSKWSKGVQSVDREDPVKSKWKAKIAFSNRSWEATTTQQIPDQRIAWTSEGQTVVNGVVSFHPLGDNLTRMLVVLEYIPHGFFEKTANLWRAQGRRARLDIKLFRRYVMMEADPEEEGWRGEIRDGEVVREHDEVVREEKGEQPSAEKKPEEGEPEEPRAEEKAEEKKEEAEVPRQRQEEEAPKQEESAGR